MPRSRNIKHSFFDNDELAENDPLGRLLFIGMWTIADHKGNFEWREKRIKKQILAYDTCDIKKLAINLDKSGFIRFYSDGDRIFINIVNFSKHQNPHKNERDKKCEVPDYTETMRQVIDLKGLAINPDLNRLNQDKYDPNRADSCSLIPDSCSLIDDSGKNKKPEKAKRFVPPQLQNVIDYCNERANNVDANKFIDHYTSNGWLVGKNKMKDWKAAVRTWEKTSFKQSGNTSHDDWKQDLLNSDYSHILGD